MKKRKKIILLIVIIIIIGAIITYLKINGQNKTNCEEFRKKAEERRELDGTIIALPAECL